MLGHYEKQFQRFHAESSEEVRQFARQNLEFFLQAGFPTTRNELWKYTSLKSLSEIPFQVVSLEDELRKSKDYEPNSALAPQNVKRTPETFLTPLDEQFRRDFATAKPYLGHAISGSNHALAALNAAFMRDGIFFRVGKNQTHNIRLDFIASEATNSDSPPLRCIRNILIVEPGATATVVENYLGEDAESASWTNSVTEVFLGENARLRHIKIQDETKNDFHWSAIAVRQSAGSQFESYYLALGSKLARQEISSTFEGQGAHCALHGLYIGDSQQHLDQQTSIDHAVPHCSSVEIYKGILDDQAQGVFNGQIFVRPQAQKTNSSLSNKNILLSREAVINTKPLLEILANDVKCSHGVTIGRLDEQQIFYLKSRGIPEKNAKQMLTMAFADEVLDGLDEVQKNELEKLIHARMQSLHEV